MKSAALTAAVLAAFIVAPARAYPAQQPDATHWKAIWEPVNYAEDLQLNDVFFVTEREGWVSGGHDELHGGVILHTTDGGEHWDVQVGDPGSSDRTIKRLRFIDPTHGWATQEDRLLHTTDGEHWQVVGTMEHRSSDYQFTSDRNGVRADRTTLFTTHDGGRNWQPSAECRTKAQVEGLTRDVVCQWVRLQFLTPQTGYAIAKAQTMWDASRRPIALNQALIARTDDGGATWNLRTAEVQGDPEDAFFIDENTGYLRTGGPDTGQLFKTTDGGATWSGMATSPGNRIAFADPQVGWSILYNKVSFTNDGGDHWSSRQYPFPTTVNAFSLPRRDRGYVVGNHGMIYRYRIVPVAYASKGMIEAPRLAALDLTVPNQFQQLARETRSLEKSVGGAPAVASAAPGTSAANSSVATDAPANDASTTTAGAATAAQDPTQQIAAVENTLNAAASQAPAFISRYRNLNLLMVGLQMTSALPQQIVDLKQSLKTLKTVKGGQARLSAVSDFSTKLQSVIAFMNTNFQTPTAAPPPSSAQ